MEKIRIGLFGVGRGMALARSVMMNGAEVVAICDFHKERRERAAEKLPEATVYENFDEFIEHDMDAVILANYFNEHAPYAIRCLEKNLHVLSECTAAGTMAEAVALVRAAEKSKAFYMIAENYPFFLYNIEMRRVVDSGSLGKIVYAEGEYNHPANPWDINTKKQFNYFPEHWRNYLPRCYYLTHSLAPLMYATGATPRRVTGMASFAPVTDDIPNASQVGDIAATMLTQNDDGSVFRFTGCAGFGAHANGYRLCGTKGQIENVRGMSPKVNLGYNSWNKPEDWDTTRKMYEPEWNDPDEELIKTTDHGGGDFVVGREFLKCIRENRAPLMDVHFATTMSSVAILAHRSILEGGKPYDIPDFHKEEDRKLWENDTLTPFIGVDGSAPTLPCCSVNDYKPTDAQLALYRKHVMGIEE